MFYRFPDIKLLDVGSSSKSPYTGANEAKKLRKATSSIDPEYSSESSLSGNDNIGVDTF